MTDMYSELLVKKEQTVKDQAIKILLIFLLVFTAIAGLILTPLAWVLTIGLGIAAYFVLPLLDLEYEYVFVNGELDIDSEWESHVETVKNMGLDRMLEIDQAAYDRMYK